MIKKNTPQYRTSPKKEGIRAELDSCSDPISGQIKAAQLDKIPWMIVLGKKKWNKRRYFSLF